MRTLLDRLGSRRFAAAVVTMIGAAYFLLVVFGNITDFDTNRQFVHHVLAMDTTFQDPDVMWRAITNPVIADIAYVGIIVWEGLTALVLSVATVAWLRSRTDPARQLSTLGFVMSILLFGGGFIVIGGEWFQMWQSSDWNGLQAALQNFIIAAVGLILVQLPRRD